MHDSLTNNSEGIPLALVAGNFPRTGSNQSETRKGWNIVVGCSCSVHDSCSTGKVCKVRYAHTHAYLRPTPLYVSCVVHFIYHREQRNVPDTCTPSRTPSRREKVLSYTNKLNVAVVSFGGCALLSPREKVPIQFEFIIFFSGMDSAHFSVSFCAFWKNVVNYLRNNVAHDGYTYIFMRNDTRIFIADYVCILRRFYLADDVSI